MLLFSVDHVAFDIRLNFGENRSISVLRLYAHSKSDFILNSLHSLIKFFMRTTSSGEQPIFPFRSGWQETVTAWYMLSPVSVVS